jgi:hypothetical protein
VEEGRLGALLAAAGLRHEARTSEHGEPQAGFRVVRANGEVARCLAVLRRKVLQLLVLDVVPGALRAEDARAFEEINRYWRIARVYHDATANAWHASLGLFVGEDGGPSPESIQEALATLLDAVEVLRGREVPEVDLAPVEASACALDELAAELAALGYEFARAPDGPALRARFEDPLGNRFDVEMAIVADCALFVRGIPLDEGAVVLEAPEALEALNARVAMGAVVRVGESYQYWMTLPLDWVVVGADLAQYLVGRCAATMEAIRQARGSG